MTRPDLISVRLDAEVKEHVVRRSAALQLSTSEYIRRVLRADLEAHGTADRLAHLNAEMSIMSALFLRRLLAKVLDDPNTVAAFESSAEAKAAQLIREELEASVQG